MALPQHARLLLTGATGHTGSKLAWRLAGDGFRVRAFSRSRGKAARILSHEFPGEVAEGNLEQPETIASALTDCDALVSVSHVKFAPALIAGCRATGVRRALFTSSARRYTRFPDRPAEWVRAAEEAIRACGLAYTIIRPTMIFGDERDQNLAGLVRLIGWTPVFPLPGGGLNLVQPTFVHDLVDVILRALRTEVSLGREYDIGGAEALTYRALIRFIARALGRRVAIMPTPLWPALGLAAICEQLSRRPRLTRGMLLRLTEDKVVDIAPARRDLGYEPTPFEEAIARKVAGHV